MPKNSANYEVYSQKELAQMIREDKLPCSLRKQLTKQSLIENKLRATIL